MSSTVAVGIIKITGCENPASWYAGLVGQIFTVEDGITRDTDGKDKYTVKAPEGQDPLFFISVIDTKKIL